MRVRIFETKLNDWESFLRLVMITGLAVALLTGCRGSAGISDLPTPTPGAPQIVLQWFRTGGIAGFCDEMTITSDGLARIGNCKNPALEEAGPRPLQAEPWSQLQSWLDTVGSYSEALSDGDVPDAMTVTIIYNGTGVGVAQEVDKEAMQGFAARLYTDMLQLAEAGCAVTAIADSDVYQRPDWDAQVLGSLETGGMVAPEAQTADGWLGFDPDAEQSGSTGLFRLRWLAPNAQVTRELGCEVLPLVPPISAETCYLIAQAELPVQSGPSDRSATLATLPAGGFVAFTGERDGDWLQVDLADSSLPQSGTGWVRSDVSVLDGPCAETTPG